MSTRITITTVFLIGLVCGVLLGLWLASLWTPPPTDPCADSAPVPSKREGNEGADDYAARESELKIVRSA